MKPFREALKAPSSALQNLFSTVCLGMCLLLVVHYINTTSVNLQSAAVVLRKGTEPRKRLTSTTTSTTNTTSNSVAASSATTSRPGSTCAHRVMSVVSGYINIGSFRKGPAENVHSRKDYASWIQPLRLIKNPLVFYSDDVEMLRLVRKLRAEHQLLGCTHTQLLNRSELWGFKLVDNISRVINRTDYPKLYPNTVVPEYAAVMHAKFDMLQLTLQSNPFDTEMIAWMDSGLFRLERRQNEPILLLPPNGFNKNLVAFNQVAQPNFYLNLTNIFYSELDWYVGGGFFFATTSVMRQWCEQYRLFTEYFLRLNLSNSDQQVIYGMYTKEVAARTDADKPALRVRLQRYAPLAPVPGGSWYHLRWLSQDEGKRWITRESTLAKWSTNATGARTLMWYMLRYLDLSATNKQTQERYDGATTDSKKLNKLKRTKNCDYTSTVVTAYFSFGAIAGRSNRSFESDGSADELWLVRDADLYSTWLSSLAKVSHPVVAYFDCPVMRGRFQLSRKRARLEGCTYTQLVRRRALWSWHAEIWIDKLRQTRTTNDTHTRTHTRTGTADERSTPEYLAALHSKYALLEKATDMNPFNTSDFVWLDPAVFRGVSNFSQFEVKRTKLANPNSVEVHFEWKHEEESVNYEHHERNPTVTISKTNSLHQPETDTKSSDGTKPLENEHEDIKNATCGKSAISPCIYDFSTRYLAGSKDSLNALSRNYRVATEVSLARQLILNEVEVLLAMYCRSDFKSFFSKTLYSSLPELSYSKQNDFLQGVFRTTAISTHKPKTTTSSSLRNLWNFFGVVL